MADLPVVSRVPRAGPVCLRSTGLSSPAVTLCARARARTTAGLLARHVPLTPPAGVLQGWKAKVCNETGDTFYYHKETKKTQWDKPLTRVASLKHEEKKIIGELAKIEVTRLEAELEAHDEKHGQKDGGGQKSGSTRDAEAVGGEPERQSGAPKTLVQAAEAVGASIEEITEYPREDLVEVLTSLGIGVVVRNRIIKEAEARKQAQVEQQHRAMDQARSPQRQQPAMNQADAMQEQRRRKTAGYTDEPQNSDPGDQLEEKRKKVEGKSVHCCELFCCVTGLAITLLSAVLFLLMMAMATSDVTEHTNTNHLLLLTGFFATLVGGSCVGCMLYLSPRYKSSEANGGRKLLVKSKTITSLQASDNWVWSMSLRVGWLKWPYVFGMSMFMVSLKFTQLFALTYDENAISTDNLPEIYLQIGDFVLLDIEELVKEDNSTFHSGLDRMFELAENSSLTSGQYNTAQAAAKAQLKLEKALHFAAGSDLY